MYANRVLFIALPSLLLKGINPSPSSYWFLTRNCEKLNEVLNRNKIVKEKSYTLIWIFYIRKVLQIDSFSVLQKQGVDIKPTHFKAKVNSQPVYKGIFNDWKNFVLHVAFLFRLTMKLNLRNITDVAVGVAVVTS